jgi:hypothetical protein
MADYRGNRPNMGLQTALNELVKERERITKKIDAMAAALENLQNLAADIGHAMKTIQAVMESQVSVGEKIVVEDIEREDPEPTIEERPSYWDCAESLKKEVSLPPPPPPPVKSKPLTSLDNKFRCDLCRCNFLNESALQNHNAAHHSDRPKEKVRSSPWRQKFKKITCQYCKKVGRPKVFDSEEALEDHIALKHPEKLEEAANA